MGSETGLVVVTSFVRVWKEKVMLEVTNSISHICREDCAGSCYLRAVAVDQVSANINCLESDGVSPIICCFTVNQTVSTVLAFMKECFDVTVAQAFAAYFSVQK